MDLKLRRNVGLSLIPIAFFFLFEPYFILIDPLPNFIGYIILAIALTNLADINYHILDARNGFKKGIAISIFRFIALYVLKNVFAAEEQSVGRLLFSFSLSVFELVILIPAYKNLFDGLLALGMMHEGTYVYNNIIRKKLKIDKKTGEKTLYVRKSRHNVSERAYFLTVAFLLISCLAATLPEFTSLIDNSSYEFVNLIRGLGYIIALPFGIAWLVNIVKYFAELKKDTQFIDNLTKLYVSEIRQRPNIFTVREVTALLFTLLAAFVASFDFFVDYINIVPNAIFYVLILASIFVAMKYSKLWIPISVFSTVGIIISTLTRYFAKVLYVNNEFTPLAIKKDLEVYLAYYRVVSFTILDAIWMLMTAILVVFLIWSIYKKHTNYAPASENKAKSEIKELKGRFIAGAACAITSAVASAAANIYYVMIQPHEDLGVWYIYYAPAITIAISILSTLAFVYFIMFIVNSVKYRYKMDV